MKYFEMPADSNLRPYAEKLEDLMDHWETETVEFKEVKGNGYDTDKTGRYVSALSNEANLRQLQNGWLIFGVSETQERHLVGTNFKEGDPSLLEKFKGEIAKGTTGGLTFEEIVDLHLKSNGCEHRVLMFKVPAATTGIPTEWRTRAYARSGDSLVLLQQDKVDRIRAQERYDWSKQIISGSDISQLDPEAIAIARMKFKEKLNGSEADEEVDQMSDHAFLTKLKLMVNGKLTNAALLLLGKEEHDNLFSNPPKVMWRLYGADRSDKDYQLFGIPFITVINKVFSKIRNLTYRYMPNQQTLFPMETQQYDSWMLRELLNNCIAHSNYRLGGRIYVNEFEDMISISNPGTFLPKSIEQVLQPGYNPPFYLNQLLADTMVHFHMIDTAAMGIRRVYRIQRDKFFPLPDYDLSVSNQVKVTVHGKILNENYMHILFNHPELGMDTVYLLDQVQKGHGSELSPEALRFLRKNGLVEGKKPNIYLSASVSEETDSEAQYIKNKGFNDKYYKDLITELLITYHKANRKKITELLWDKLPNQLDEKQKRTKISSLLTSMRKEGIITTDSDNQQISNWVLVENG